MKRPNSRIVHLAITRLVTQGETPLSPFSTNPDGSIRLCAAAAVASAAMENHQGLSGRLAFERLLQKSADSSLIDRTFVSLGLDPKVCRTLKRFNDSIPEKDRREKVIDFLNSEMFS